MNTYKLSDQEPLSNKDIKDILGISNEELEIVYDDSNKPHEVCEVACLKCLHRWIAVYPTMTWLKELECPCCHKHGFVIKTGQTLPESEDTGDE